MAFTLIMLGTDTYFTPEPTLDYARGETLSVISTLIEGGEAKRDDTLISPFVSSHLEVIIGPKTSGGNVNDRIQRGVLAILRAIAAGHKDIVIISHSRGAVEAVLIAHEIHEIKRRICEASVTKEQNSELTLAQIISELAVLEKEDTVRNTGSVMQTLQTSLDYQTIINAISPEVIKNITKTTLYTFSIDPVPGNGPGIDWNDKRFYKFPGIVRDAHVTMYANEFSRCFMGLRSTSSEPAQTNLKHLLLPGHHGTGSNGNNKDQARNVNPKGDTTDVQLMLFFKCLAFLNQHGVIIKQPKDWPIPDANSLQHHAKQFLDSLGIQYTSFHDEQLIVPACFKLYSKILDNREAYLHFNTTNYKFLGRTSVTDRYINTESLSGKVIKDFFPPIHGFVNAEHAEMAQKVLFKLLHIEEAQGENVKLVDIVNEATQKLFTGIAAADQSAQPSAANEIATLVRTPVGKEKITEALSILIDSICQRYLRNDLPSADKLALLNAIKKTFKQFADLEQTIEQPTKGFHKLEQPIKAFISEIQKHLRESITKKIKQQYNSALLDTDNLITHFKTPSTPLKEKFSALIYGNFPPVTQGDNKEVSLFNEAFSSTVLLSDQSVTNLWHHLKQHLQQKNFWSTETMDEVEKWNDEALVDYFDKVLIDAPVVTVDDIGKAGKRLQEFRKDLLHFKEFGLELDYDDMAEHLRVKESLLLTETSMEKSVDYSHFNQLHTKLRIAYGREDTEKLALQKTIEQLTLQSEQQHLQLTELQRSMSQKKSELTVEIIQLKEEVSVFRDENTRSRNQVKQLEEKLVELGSSEQLIQTKSRAFETQLEALNQANKELSLQFEDSQYYVQQLSLAQEKMVSQCQRLDKANEELHQQIKNKALQIPFEIEQLNNLNKDLTLLKERLETQVIEQSDGFASRKQELLDQINRLKQENKDDREKFSVHEANLLIIIAKRIMPLVERYNQHLQSLPVDVQVRAKMVHVKKMHDALTNTQKYPSKQITDFYNALANSDASLTEHRDGMWKRYIQNALSIAAILITGILPGLITVAIVSHYKQRNSMSFWQSHGEDFHDAVCEEMLEQDLVEENDEGLLRLKSTS